MTMSKTSAIKAARAAVGQITRTGEHSYRFFAPYYSGRTNGPTTEVTANSYWKAREYRTLRVALLALELMGIKEDGEWLHVGYHGTTVDELVNAGMPKHF